MIDDLSIDLVIDDLCNESNDSIIDALIRSSMATSMSKSSIIDDQIAPYYGLNTYSGAVVFVPL